MSITSPMALMRRFEKLTKIKNTKTYLNMQKHYMSGQLKKGFYSTSKSIVTMDRRLEKADKKIKSGINSGALKADSDNNIAKEIFKASNLILGARLFGTWRNTASVYKIDEDVAKQALTSEIPDETPSEMFLNLPEWCVYMEAPASSNILHPYMQLHNDGSDHSTRKRIVGFWAMKDDLGGVGKAGDCNLDIFFNFEHDDDVSVEQMNIVPLRILISPNLTIIESLKLAYGELGANWEKDLGVQHIKTVLGLLLWVCVEEPDITNAKQIPMSRADIKKPRFVKSKESSLFIAPYEERHLHIASRLGGEIREYQKEIEHAKNNSLPKRRIPHIRRGHWTSVWVGSGDNKWNKVYWQDAVFVNGK